MRAFGVFALVVASFFGSGESFAAQRFKLAKGGTVLFEIPSQWKAITGFMSTPLTIVSPMKNGSRAGVNVTPLGKLKSTIDLKALQDTQHDYQEGREAWVKKRGGRAIAFDPLQHETWPNGVEAYSVGYTFSLEEDEFAEKTYFLKCKDRFYHLKKLLRKDQEELHAAAVDSLIRSFHCE